MGAVQLGQVDLQNMKNWYTMQSQKVGGASPIETPQITPTEYVGGVENFFVPNYKSPDITGGTHINGLGKAGEKFDSYKLFK